MSKFTPEVLAAASNKKTTKQKKSSDKPKLDGRKPVKSLNNENGPAKSKEFPAAEVESTEKSNKSKKQKKNNPNKTGDRAAPAPQTVTKMFAKPSQTGNKWYEEELPSSGRSDESNFKNDVAPQYLRPEEIGQIKKTAVGLLEADVQAYKAGNCRN